jgi:branched-chain amino acid transport system permease protein
MGGLSVDQMPVPHFLAFISPQTYSYFFVVGTVMFLIIFAYNLMHHSPIGRAFRTIKCDVEISTILGIPVVKYKLLAFALSALYASTAGSLIMYLNKFISTDSYTVNDSIDYIVAAVVGGPESILGCSIGGLFLTFEKDIAASMGHLVFRGNFLTRMFYGVLMILIVFVAARGIGGEFTRRLKSKFLSKPQRGKYYYSPPPDYDFLNMKGSTIKEE